MIIGVRPVSTILLHFFISEVKFSECSVLNGVLRVIVPKRLLMVVLDGYQRSPSTKLKSVEVFLQQAAKIGHGPNRTVACVY